MNARLYLLEIKLLSRTVVLALYFIKHITIHNHHTPSIKFIHQQLAWKIVILIQQILLMLSNKLATTNWEKSYRLWPRGRGLTKRELVVALAKGGPQNPGRYGDAPLPSPVEHNCVAATRAPDLGRVLHVQPWKLTNYPMPTIY